MRACGEGLGEPVSERLGRRKDQRRSPPGSDIWGGFAIGLIRFRNYPFWSNTTTMTTQPISPTSIQAHP